MTNHHHPRFVLDCGLDANPVFIVLVCSFRHCPSDHVCLPGLGNNPNFGYTNFDTFPWSMLTTFQLITLDYWENIYNMVLAACGPYTIVFFMIVVFFGAFYLINLMLAVVAMSYDDEAGSNNQVRAHLFFNLFA